MGEETSTSTNSIVVTFTNDVKFIHAEMFHFRSISLITIQNGDLHYISVAMDEMWGSSSMLARTLVLTMAKPQLVVAPTLTIPTHL